VSHYTLTSPLPTLHLPPQQQRTDTHYAICTIITNRNNHNNHLAPSIILATSRAQHTANTATHSRRPAAPVVSLYRGFCPNSCAGCNIGEAGDNSCSAFMFVCWTR
ncbi:hypothetical protein BaRGS_00039447, partial [Batillaria attramentaria]